MKILNKDMRDFLRVSNSLVPNTIPPNNSKLDNSKIFKNYFLSDIRKAFILLSKKKKNRKIGDYFSNSGITQINFKISEPTVS